MSRCRRRMVSGDRMDVTQIGRLILVAGIALVVLGGVFMLAGRIPIIGQLPGDIQYERGNTTVYIPIATMILISIVLTLVLNLILRR